MFIKICCLRSETIFNVKFSIETLDFVKEVECYCLDRISLKIPGADNFLILLLAYQLWILIINEPIMIYSC